MKEVDRQIALLKDENKSGLVRWRAVDTLIKVGTPAISPLIEALKISHTEKQYSESRKYALRALTEIGSPAVPLLIETLKIKDVRYSSEEALIKIGTPAVPLLIETLKNTSHDGRWLVASALGEIGDTSAVTDLIQALNDPKDDVRWASAKALGTLGDFSATLPLIQTLSDPDTYVRCYAAQALGEIGAPSAIPAVVEALEDTDVIVRRSAAEALEKIALKHPTAHLREAIPILKRHLKSKHDGSYRNVETYQEALAAIEQATTGMKDIPITAPAPSASADSLPIPAEETASPHTTDTSPARKGLVQRIFRRS